MKIISNKPTITRKDLEVVLDCLINDELTIGNTTKSFENEISKIIGFKYGLSTTSLTASYHLIFQALGIEEGDEIIIPSFFDSAPLKALSIHGGKPVFVDSDKDSFFPSPEAIKNKITEKTKAVIVSHLFGFFYPTEELGDLTIPIIEDTSHAIGTSNDDIKIGSKGAFTVISFNPSMIITTGNGGIVLTNNSKHYSKMRDFRGGNDSIISFDYTMTDFQGAMGISQLLKLKNMLERRRKIASIYYDALKITGHKAYYQYDDKFSYQTFPILFDASIDKIEKYWKKNGIQVINPIAYPLHSLAGMDNSDFPNSTRLSKKLFALPTYPTLSGKHIDKISRTLSRFI